MLSVDCIFLPCADPLMSYCVILAPLTILMFAISSKVLFNLLSDSLSFSVASSVNYFLSQLISGVSCDAKYLNCDGARRTHLPGARPAVPKFLVMAHILA